MDLKKRLPLIMTVVALVSIVGALLLFILAAPRADAVYKRVLEIIIGVLLLIMAALIFVYLYQSQDAEPNYFLFDRSRRRNMDIEELTFDTVNERMTHYVQMIKQTPEELWKGDALESDRKLGFRRVYRPLLAYKMLYDLSEKTEDDPDWNLLIKADAETMGSVYSALEQGGERNMVKAFRYIMITYQSKPERIRDFIIGNQKYLRGRMLSYIKKNIELFY